MKLQVDGAARLTPSDVRATVSLAVYPVEGWSRAVGVNDAVKVAGSYVVVPATAAPAAVVRPNWIVLAATGRLNVIEALVLIETPVNPEPVPTGWPSAAGGRC